MAQEGIKEIKAIIGLGNPGKQYYHNRHNIGFQLVDMLASKFHGKWQAKPFMEVATITINGHTVILIKPQTFMNDSGKVISYLNKQGIKAENILVAHDELELPFGQIKTKQGGSAKGHNGLKSIIAAGGDMFHRLRVGIGRPENREAVPSYVLQDFVQELPEIVELLEKAVGMIEDMFA